MKSNLKIVWRTKIIFLLSKIMLFFIGQKYILLSETYFFKIPKNLITAAFFLPKQILKNIEMPRQKPQMLGWKNLLIKNDHVINCAIFFRKWFKHGQTSNVLWLSRSWHLIFHLEVSNKKFCSPQSLLVYELKFPVKKI